MKDQRLRMIRLFILLPLAAVWLAPAGGAVPAAFAQDSGGVVVKKKLAPGESGAPIVRKKLPEPPPPPVAQPAGPPVAQPAEPPAAGAAAPAAAAGAQTARSEEPPPAPPPPPAAEPAARAAAPAAAPPPQVAPGKIAAAKGAAPFSILLASHREKRNALAELESYRRAGLAPTLALTEIPGKGSFWRTLAGGYPSLAEALAARERLKLPDAVVVKTPFANLVGEFRAEAEAAALAGRLAELGFYAYTLPGAGGEIRLFVGAYPSEAGAEQDRLELRNRGVEARTVRR